MISVIIPVYNAAPYLRACLDSVLAQSYTDLEILLINDGSTDESPAICRQYAQKDARIRLIDQENGGVSRARNVGLANAAGDYITFVDSDDRISPDYLERLYAAACTHHADIACCNLQELLNGEPVEFNTPKVLHPRLVTDQQELFFDFVDGKEAYATSVCAKIIRRSLATQANFRPIAFGEDQVYMFDLFTLSPAVYLDDFKGYYYIRNESSATLSSGTLNLKRNRDELQMQRYKLEHLPQSVRSLYPRYYDRYAMSVCVLAKTATLLPDRSQRKDARKAILAEIRTALQGKQWISKRNRIYLAMYRYLPWLYRALLLIKEGRSHSSGKLLSC